MEIKIKLNKSEVNHLKEQFDCASDVCMFFENILRKCRKEVILKQKLKEKLR